MIPPRPRLLKDFLRKQRRDITTLNERPRLIKEKTPIGIRIPCYRQVRTCFPNRFCGQFPIFWSQRIPAYPQESL